MSEIYFIRHGQASFGAENYDRLSPVGVWQAEVLGTHFAYIGLSFDAVYTGLMERQKETGRSVTAPLAERGAKPAEPVRDAAFNEYDAEGVWAALSEKIMREDESLLPDDIEALRRSPSDPKAFQRVFSRVMQYWVSGKGDDICPVTWSAFKKRVVEGIDRLMADCGPKKRVAVFTSGGPISVAVQMALDLSDSQAMALSWQVINASVTRFKYSSQGIMLSSFNEISHLERTGDKTLITYR